MTLAIALDVETTGLLVPIAFPKESQPRIIEFSAVLFDLETGETQDEINEYVNPFVSIPRKITSLTGIGNADVANAPSWNDLQVPIADLASKSGFVIAHNAVFDRDVIEWNCKLFDSESHLYYHDWICTMIESQWIEGKPIKMEALYEYLKGERLDQTHRAREDVQALMAIAVDLHGMGALPV